MKSWACWRQVAAHRHPIESASYAVCHWWILTSFESVLNTIELRNAIQPPYTAPVKTRFTWQFLLLAGLSLSIGWGIRGQFGHEYGAAMAGSLGCLAIAVLSGRDDWHRRAAYFAMFGGLGWALGGSMSYMKVVAYTHSPDAATALYGFANLFVLGFLWAAPGGTGCALPAYLSREKLTEFFHPISAVILGWLAQDILADIFGFLRFPGLGIIVPALAVLVLAAVRRKFDLGSRLVLYICGGWWAGMLLLVYVCGLHMSPPREDGWAGCVGLVAAILIFCARNGLGGVAFATVCTGLLGGCGFALAAAVKHVGIRTGLVTNWHSVMEQTDGLLHGLALAVAMGMIMRRAPRVSDDPPVRRWTDAYAVMFVLWLFTYLNFRKSPAEWLQEVRTLHHWLYGIAVESGFIPSGGFLGWFDLAYLALGAAVACLLYLHLRRGMPLVPCTWLGKAQLLYLVYLWSQVMINFTHTLPRFNELRLVTEWFITINAAFCTILMAVGTFAQPNRNVEGKVVDGSYRPWIRKTVAIGLLGAVLVVFASWGTKLALYGNSPVPFSVVHIRFGPNNTNDKR